MSACEQTRRVLEQLLDGELSGAAEEAARAHLAQCPACRREYEELEALSLLLAEPEPAPEGFEESVMAAVSAAAAPKKRTIRLGPVLRWGGLAACVALVLFGVTRLRLGSTDHADTAECAPAAAEEAVLFSTAAGSTGNGGSAASPTDIPTPRPAAKSAASPTDTPSEEPSMADKADGGTNELWVSADSAEAGESLPEGIFCVQAYYRLETGATVFGSFEDSAALTALEEALGPERDTGAPEGDWTWHLLLYTWAGEERAVDVYETERGLVCVENGAAWIPLDGDTLADILIHTPEYE